MRNIFWWITASLLLLWFVFADMAPPPSRELNKDELCWPGYWYDESGDQGRCYDVTWEVKLISSVWAVDGDMVYRLWEKLWNKPYEIHWSWLEYNWEMYDRTWKRSISNINFKDLGSLRIQNIDWLYYNLERVYDWSFDEINIHFKNFVTIDWNIYSSDWKRYPWDWNQITELKISDREPWWPQFTDQFYKYIILWQYDALLDRWFMFRWVDIVLNDEVESAIDDFIKQKLDFSSEENKQKILNKIDDHLEISVYNWFLLVIDEMTPLEVKVQFVLLYIKESLES